MKMKSWVLLLIITLVCFTCVSASANSWGLSSQTLLNYVMKDKTWDDYSAEVEFYKKGTSLTAAVMRSKYHSVLMIGRRESSGQGNVWVSTTAVFQPGEIDVSPKLSCTEDTVMLIYPKYDYEFVFTWDADQYPDGAFVLTSAKKAGARIDLAPEEQVYRTGDQYVWQVPPITMEGFNISLFPDTAQQFADMNRVYAALSDASGFWADTRSSKKAVKLPVFSAPDKNSYRAAKGKALVNLKSGVTLMATLEKWDLVEYEVSNRTHRVGWIEGNHLGDPAPISFTDVPVNGVAYLTDDPLCSQYRSFQGSQLRDIHLLAYLNPFYAYAKATTDDGKTAWGFVPIGLTLEMPVEKIDTESMNELVGTWVFYSGGELTSEVLRLKEDGTCEMLGLSETAAESLAWLQYPLNKDMFRDADDPTIGSWYVIDSLADNGCDKTLMIVVDSTYQSYGIYDLQPEEATGDLSMTLVYGEAGGTWARVHEENEGNADQPVNSGNEHWYINPNGGSKLHSDPYCRSVHEKYLPLQEIELTDEIQQQYSICPVCASGSQQPSAEEATGGPEEVVPEKELNSITAQWESIYGNYLLWDYKTNADFVEENGTQPDVPYVFNKSLLNCYPDEDAIPAEEIEKMAVPLIVSYGSILNEEKLHSYRIIVNAYKKPDMDGTLFSQSGSWIVGVWDESKAQNIAYIYIDSHTGIPSYFRLTQQQISYIGEPGVEPVKDND